MNVLSSGRHLRSTGVLLTAILCVHCGHDDTSGGSAGSNGGSGGKSGGGGSSGTATGGRPPNVGGGINVEPGGPNCGLGDHAAFCETFDEPASTQGRAGELDATKWSAARNQPQAPTGGGRLIGITKATLPSCRSGLPSTVFPSQDALICDANDAIGSAHLLIAAASQNYGQNTYRIRRPFDFAGRTGKIVLDGEGYTAQLLGWISVEVTEDPTPGPSFALGPDQQRNDEGSAVPKVGFEVQFSDNCAGQGEGTHVAMHPLIVIDDYAQTELPLGDKVCMPTLEGSLNHFEISVSQGRIEVYGTPFSPDGSGFETPTLLYAGDVNLPFSRGYVSITAHNHATIKYSENGAMDSWIARFDNVGFDGPIIDDVREVEVPDALVSSVNEFTGEAVMNVGYHAADVAEGPADTLTLHGVDLDGIQTARLAVSAWFLQSDTNAAYKLKFRLNGGDWHDRPLSAEESGQLSNGNNQGQIAFMIDVPVADLVAGDNTLEFVAESVPQNYPPALWNIDLVLSK